MKRRGKRGSTAQIASAVFQKHRKTHSTLSVVCKEKSEVEFGMQSPLLCQLYLRVDNETKHHIAILYCQQSKRFLQRYQWREVCQLDGQ